MEIQIQKTNKFNKKKLWLFLVPILGIALVAAAVWIANLDVTTTISEAISTAQTDIVISALVGGVTCEQVSIDNAANWDLWTALTFTETSNFVNDGLGNDVGDVTYTTDLPKTVTLSSGANMVDVCFDVTEDSLIGVITGTVTIERVAQS